MGAQTFAFFDDRFVEGCREKVAAVEFDGGAIVVCRNRPVEFENVDPRRRGVVPSDVFSFGYDPRLGGRRQFPQQPVQMAAQIGARLGFVGVGPKRKRQGGARHRFRVGGQQRKQRPRGRWSRNRPRHAVASNVRGPEQRNLEPVRRHLSKTLSLGQSKNAFRSSCDRDE